MKIPAICRISQRDSFNPEHCNNPDNTCYLQEDIWFLLYISSCT